MVDAVQGGAGTSTNMNANEVIANVALELMGKPRGDYASLHPNDDVNMAQSTNDAYPTALRLAIIFATAPLVKSLQDLAYAFKAKAVEFADVLKMGRTQLQDAVPMTLGQEFDAFHATVKEDIARIGEAAALFREVNLGATAIGTGINADPRYASLVVEELSRASGQPMALASNLIEATSDMGAFVLYSGVLKRIAVKLSKICNDLRLLSSGPRAGLGEIRLPAVQAGSSIMPGKVNPVIPEVVSQVAYLVIGHDLTVTMCAEGGQLQLNAFEPTIGYCVLTSLRTLTAAIDTLTRRCIVGIEADRERCLRAGRGQHRPHHRARTRARLRDELAHRQTRPRRTPPGRRSGAGRGPHDGGRTERSAGAGGDDEAGAHYASARESRAGSWQTFDRLRRRRYRAGAARALAPASLDFRNRASPALLAPRTRR